MRTDGFNLVGFATSPTGVGEDLRMCAAMLDHLGIPYSVHDLPSKGRAVKPSFRQMSQDRFSVSIYFSWAIHCGGLQKVFPALFEGQRLKIGFFAWELPHFPMKHIDLLGAVDHIWCPARFVRDSTTPVTRQPVMTVPLPTRLAEPAGTNFRQQFNIPSTDFVVLYLFDMLSGVNRKNPDGTLKAFLQFAANKDDAWLILKAHGMNADTARDWERALGNPRIKIMVNTVSPGELTDLYDAADCYLSLHRSEGYGRTLVEALQSGLPVVATGFSAPLDYLDDTNAALVRWTKKEVKPWEYLGGQESWWADPVLSDAVTKLDDIYCRRQSLDRDRIRAHAQQWSVPVLAERYERLFDACIQYRTDEQFQHDIAGLLPLDALALPVNPYQLPHPQAAADAVNAQEILIDRLMHESQHPGASAKGVLEAQSLLINLNQLDPVRRQVKTLGYALARLMQPALAARDISTEPRKHHLPCKATTQADMESPWFAYWCKQLNVAPICHRKLWELAYVLQVLFDHALLRPGTAGIGFGCGAEPLASWFAAQQIDVVISDLPVADVIGMGWMETGQHASAIDTAWYQDLVPRDLFDRHVRHRFIDMNAIPAMDERFDFCWSICALEHVGSITQAMAFIENSLSVLRPGGVAVHTTEFNYLSQSETIEHGPTVLLLRRHFEELAAALEAKGHRIAGMDFDVGDKPMDQFVDLPPYGPGQGYYALDERDNHEQAGHLKISVDRYPCTCFGLVIQKSG